LDLVDPVGAYGHNAVIGLVLLVAARQHLSVAALIAGWRDFDRGPDSARIFVRARALAPDDRFDLVVELDHARIVVATSDTELIEAVRHPRGPRPVVVLDLAERVRHASMAFHRLANRSPRPAARHRGRPKRQARAVRSLGEKA